MKRSELWKELKALGTDDLKERARSMAEELMKLRFRSASGQLQQGHRIREVRRNLARARTLLSERHKSEQRAGARA